MIAVEDDDEEEHEQKQTSFLDDTDDDEIQEHRRQSAEHGALLRNESSFLQVSDDDDEDDHDDRTVDTQLSSCTQFQLSSRPTTAIPENVAAEYQHTEQLAQHSDRSPSPKSHVSYSSCGGDMSEFKDEQQDDPFTIHVVVDDDNENDSEHEQHDEPCRQQTETTPESPCEAENKWKHISDVDRSNVASLRDALQQISHETFPVYDEENEQHPQMEDEQDSDDNNHEDEEDGDTNKEEEDEDEEEKEDEEDMMEDNIPIATPNTSFSAETFVVKYVNNKQESRDKEEDEKENDEEYDENEGEEIEYEEDFEVETHAANEKGSNGKRESQKQEMRSRKRDVLRLPELDASINHFESQVYDVYSSFDESLMTNSVASSSDLSRQSPAKQQECQTIPE
mmetsp:Transcript_51061/g.81343  ORF Transcript_51061/g.81343 Transcript_51061/m.81343 type:complete len:395 (-) Transcript_51061:97-1281(-)